jgi:hypothetical protein
LAVGLGREAIVAGYTVLFTGAMELMANLAKAQSDGRPSSPTPWSPLRSPTGCFTTARSSPSGATAIAFAKSAAAGFCTSPLRRPKPKPHQVEGGQFQVSPPG